MITMILVTDCTTPISKGVIHQLHQLGHRVTGITQDDNHRTSTTANTETLNVTAVNLLDQHALNHALSNINTVFLSVRPSPTSTQAELNIIRACQEQGIKTIIKIATLLPAPHQHNEQDYFKGQQQVENALTASGIPHLLLRPTLLMQTLLDKLIAPQLTKSNTFTLPFSDHAVNAIDLNDVAAVSTYCLIEAPSAPNTIVLTGFDPLTMQALANQLSQALERPIQYQNQSMRAYFNAPSQRDASAFDNAYLKGLYSLITNDDMGFYTDTVQHITGHLPRPINAYLAEHKALFNRGTHSTGQKAA